MMMVLTMMKQSPRSEVLGMQRCALKIDPGKLEMISYLPN
jgi:hypothetical protein